MSKSFFSKAKDTLEEAIDAVKDYKTASDLGTAIGQDAYRRGVEPGDLSWGTIEQIAQENNLNLDQYINCDIVADHINDGFENAAYDDEERAKPFWKRGW